ncbi:MAG TPA: aspartyl-phosphate phosphatase Spo0E family protein [Desulfosporosinus sp.]|nr:aspartyl-phosphate phosphatase Spo0E family protein [Desulfosporosinus sp.]
MPKLKELHKEIEILRSTMIKIKEGKCFSHPEVVAVSQELDAVLDRYEIMKAQCNKRENSPNCTSLNKVQ